MPSLPPSSFHFILLPPLFTFTSLPLFLKVRCPDKDSRRYVEYVNTCCALQPNLFWDTMRVCCHKQMPDLLVCFLPFPLQVADEFIKRKEECEWYVNALTALVTTLVCSQFLINLSSVLSTHKKDECLFTGIPIPTSRQLKKTAAPL